MKKRLENFFRNFFKTEGMFCLFLFLLPWQTRLILRPGVLGNGNWEYGIIGIYGTEILLWLAVLIKFIKDRRRARIFLAWPAGKNFPRLAGGQEFFILLFLVYLFLRALASPDKSVALQQFWHLLEAGLFFWILKDGGLNKSKAAFWFIFGLLIQAGLGIGQFLAQETFASRWLGLTLHEAAAGGVSVLENFGGRWLRAYGGLPHPNVFGGYMLAGIVLILFSRPLIEKQRQKIFFNSALPILAAALFFSFSRSAWLGLVVALLVFLVFEKAHFHKKPRFKEKSSSAGTDTGAGVESAGSTVATGLLFSIVLIAILSFIFRPILAGRVSGIGRLEVQSVTARMSGYAEAAELFKKNYFLGVGPGNYTLVAYNLHPGRPVWEYQPAHNVLVLAVVEIGLIGAIGSGFVLLLIFKKHSVNYQF
ncbi:MAG: O-antigen ligase family protein, partial [Candidatus Magasanikbacteria bacterium]|nr:O-antigen ligase family protein [Candidatus Magasanikbacteria bacterium]